MTAHDIEAHDLIEVSGHDRQYFYRVLGNYLGGVGTASVTTLEAVNEIAPQFGERSRTIAVPTILLEAGLSNGTFSHLKRGPYPLS